MFRSSLALAVAGLIVAAGAAEVHAQARQPAPQPLRASASLVPHSGFFVGLGGGFNSVNFGTQDVYAVGTSDVFTAGVLTSSGSAWGPAYIGMPTETEIGFSAQLGYFERFTNSPWLWGVKFNYSYLGVTSTKKNALLPQAGAFTPTGGTVPVPFTGNAVVRDYETSLVHQFALMPIIGHAFERSFVYAGAGPTLSQTRTDLNGVIGFADINGQRTDVSGDPIDLSSTSWVWGGAATIGVTYFLDRSWFLDINYTAAMTAKHTSSYFSPFTNPNGTGGTVVTGTLVGTTEQSLVTQQIMVTINRTF